MERSIPMHISSLPIHRPDETLYSLAVRIRRRNAARHDRDACRELFGPFNNMRVAEFPVNVDFFVNATQGYFGDPRSVIAHATLEPFFARVGGHPWHCGSAKPSLATAGYGLSMLSNGSLRTWRACAECLREDKKRNPYSYWRRAHQLPTAFLCLEHRELLRVCRVPPKHLHIQFYLPAEMSLVDSFKSIDPISHFEVLALISQFSVDILHENSQILNSPTINAAIMRALEALNMTSTTGKIRRPSFVAEFARRFSFLRHHPDFAKSVSAAGMEILCRSLEKPSLWRQSAQTILLVSWLFGTWNALKEECIAGGGREEALGIDGFL